jgi:hypothetical protein
MGKIELERIDITTRSPTMTTRQKQEENGVPPTQVARYNLETGKLPKSVKPQLRDYLFELNHALHQATLQPISTLIAYVPQYWSLTQEEIELYAFGNFRSPYKVIERLADVFAGLYTKYTILPLVTPVSKAEWAKEVKHEGMIKRNIQTNGLVIYEQ